MRCNALTRSLKNCHSPVECSRKLEVHWGRDLLLSCHSSVLCLLLAEIDTASVEVQSPCHVPFPLYEVKRNWSEVKVWTSLHLHYSIHLPSECFVMADIALREYSFRLKSIMRCCSPLGTRDFFMQVFDALLSANSVLTTALSIYKIWRLNPLIFIW